MQATTYQPTAFHLNSKKRFKLKRQFLHAQRLAFGHPVTGERMVLVCELPVGLRAVMDKLR